MGPVELKRKPNWRAELMAYLGDCARNPFDEGTHDCALFLAGGVEAMTGVDFAADYRGHYTSTRQGLKILRENGFRDHVALATYHLPHKAVAFANEGDGAVVPEDGTEALGIVQGAMIYVLRPGGLGAVPLTSAKLVLRV